MYLPFLRGKQFELFALSELINQGLVTKSTLPLIEPVKSNTKRLENVIGLFQKHSLDIIVISNPSVGELKKNQRLIPDFFSGRLESLENVIHGFLISSATSVVDIENIIKEFGNMRFCFIHQSPFKSIDELNKLCQARGDNDIHVLLDARELSAAYVERVESSQKVLLRDGFQRQKVNSEYPEFSFFSDLKEAAMKLGYIGFSDYSIIGKDYSASGGPARCVAIHLTNIEDDNLWIRHFKSESDLDSIANVNGKAHEATVALLAWLAGGEYCGIQTSGLAEYQASTSPWAFHGLGHFKKLSIKHHIELIQSTIAQ